MSRTIVCDFDKTLTYRDTLFGFYLHCSKKNIFFPFKVLLYVKLMILAKMGLITNHRLKRLGFIFFIEGQKILNLESKSKNYASKIKLNKLFYNLDFQSSANNIIIISASYEIYIKYIFPSNVKVFGSTINSKDGIINKFTLNCYAENKLSVLKKNKINNIKRLYTDSYSDISLANISNEIIIVKNDNLYECKDINDFKSYFSK